MIFSYFIFIRSAFQRLCSRRGRMQSHDETVATVPRNPGRPALLGEYLDITKEQSAISSVMYNAFILSSKATQAKCECTTSISVQVSGKVCPLSDQVEGSLQGDTVDSGEADGNDLPKPLTKHEGLLDHILDFYARFSSKGATSFAGIDSSYESWGMTELETFCRDFSLVPNIVSRDELRSLFQYMFLDRKLSGRGILKVLKIDELREFLVRLAIFIWGKPGIVELLARAGVDIVDGNGPADRVLNLIHYLRFSDANWVKKHIRTEGRKTQGKHNYISKLGQEAKVVAYENTQTDLRHKTLTASPSSSSSSPSSPSHATSPSSKRTQLPTNQQQQQQLLRHKHSMQHKQAASSGARARLPPDIADLIAAGPPASLAVIPEPSPDTEGSSRPPSPSSSLPPLTPSSPQLAPSAAALEFQEQVDEAEAAYELTASQELYTPDLLSLLTPFCRDAYNDETETHTRIVHSQGAFLDLGRLERGAQVTIKLHITNTSDDVLRFDISARNFDTDTEVRTLPSQLIPGLARTAIVTFKAGNVPCCHVGYIDVKWANDRNATTADSVELPIFYFVGLRSLDDKARDHSTLTVATLQGQVRQRLGLRPPTESLGKRFGLRRKQQSQTKPSGGLSSTTLGSTDSMMSLIYPHGPMQLDGGSLTSTF